MGILSQIKDAFGGKSDGVYRAEASIDLDILYNHDEASKLLVAVDMPRLERINRDRRAKAHYATGDIKVQDGSLEWSPNRAERSCGIRDIVFTKEELRHIDMQPTVVIAILKDGTNVAFVVNKQSAASGGRSIPSIRPAPKNPQ